MPCSKVAVSIASSEEEDAESSRSRRKKNERAVAWKTLPKNLIVGLHPSR